MPELPEIEVIRRGLQATLVGRTIHQVTVFDPRVVATSIDELTGRLPGQRVGSVDRRGKYLILQLDRDCVLIHLGMTGQLTFWDKSRNATDRFHRHPHTGLQRTRQHEVDEHTHLVVRFADGNGLHYRDIRKFGRIRLVKPGELPSVTNFASLGLEPFSPKYRYEPFECLLAGRKCSIKAFLLDQHAVAGLGNIYADEALFEAGIRPTRRAGGLTRRERRRLFEAIRVVLKRGIEFGGTSLRDYINSNGERGSNQERLFVYGRAGEPCRVCQTPIERIVLVHRSTHYCPRCQNRWRDLS